MTTVGYGDRYTTGSAVSLPRSSCWVADVAGYPENQGTPCLLTEDLYCAASNALR